jgi:hypothetical protein
VKKQCPETTVSVPVNVTTAFNQMALLLVVLKIRVFCPVEIFGITL